MVFLFADSMADAKEQVKTATTQALQETFAVNGNRDITKFLPALIGCIARPVRGWSMAGVLWVWRNRLCGGKGCFEHYLLMV